MSRNLESITFCKEHLNWSYATHLEKELRYKMMIPYSMKSPFNIKQNESKLEFSDGKSPWEMLVFVRNGNWPLCLVSKFLIKKNSSFDLKVTRNYCSFAIAMVGKNLQSRTESFQNRGLTFSATIICLVTQYSVFRHVFRVAWWDRERTELSVRLQ